MKKILVSCFVFLALSFVCEAQTPDAVTMLKGFDPVDLVDGREVKGLDTLSVTRGHYRYLFATGANRKRFVKSPAEYQIQMGGGRGRMGSLSGSNTIEEATQLSGLCNSDESAIAEAAQSRRIAPPFPARWQQYD